MVAVQGLAARLGVHTMVGADGTHEELMREAQEEVGPDDEGPRQPKRPYTIEPGSGMAVLPVEGELVHKFGYLQPFSGMTGYDGIQARLRAAAADPEVRGILLDVDSPGGEVTGLESAVQTVREVRQQKPVWAMANEVMASAALWLASAADVVTVPPTGLIGSIGVVLLHVDQSQMLSEAGLTVTLIQSGTRKTEGNPYEPLPDDVRRRLQGEVDTLGERFVAAVAANRGLDRDAVRQTQAATYLGTDVAAALPGLVDAVATPQDVARSFAEKLRNQ